MPGAGDDWARLLGTCAQMWHASQAFLAGRPYVTRAQARWTRRIA